MRCFTFIALFYVYGSRLSVVNEGGAENTVLNSGAEMPVLKCLVLKWQC